MRPELLPCLPAGPQVLGAGLVGSLAEVNTEAEHALASLHQLVPLLLSVVAQPGSDRVGLGSARSAAGAAAAAGSQAAAGSGGGSAGAAAGSDGAQDLVSVQAGALQALERYVSLCNRLRCR